MATKKAYKPGKRGTVHVLTEDQKICAHLFVKYGSNAGASKASEILGVNAEAIKALIKTPAVQRYLQQFNQAFLKEIARYELSRITRYGVTREDVIGRLHALALTPPDETRGNLEGQVAALNSIADILGLKFNPRDADTFFKDRTPQELESYARYGKFDPTEEEKAALDAATKPTPQS